MARAQPEADSVNIRLGRQEDCEQIALMSRDLVEEGLNWRWRASRIQRFLRDPEGTVVVAEASDKMAGFALMIFAETSAHLALLAVDPVRRRQGVAGKLVDWLEGSCRVAGLERVNLEVRAQNLSAQCFYKTIGYQVVKLNKGYYEGKEDAVVMSHQLIPAEVERERP